MNARGEAPAVGDAPTEVCSFIPSRPPWPSQMCARCGDWRDRHPASSEERDDA